MPPWQLIAWVKFIAAVVELRPRALARDIAHRDRKLRHGIRWYYRIGRRIWVHEVWKFLFRDRRVTAGPTLAGFWGAPKDANEEAMPARTRERPVAHTRPTRRASS